MTTEFTIPKRPEELAHEDCTYDIRVTNLRELHGLKEEDLRTFTQSMHLAKASLLALLGCLTADLKDRWKLNDG